MRNMTIIALVTVLCFGCGKDSDKKKPEKQPAEGPAPATATDNSAKPPAPAPTAPRDPRIAELFAAGKDCTWNDSGLASCEAADKMKKLAFEQQSDSKLAASCAAALRDPEPTTRGLAAVCMSGFNDRTRIPLLAAGLDAFEAEKEPTLRAAIACAFSNGNARESGVEDRVIALVRKLAAEPGGDVPASCLLDSMFPQYLMQASEPPSKAAGDLALEMLGKEGRLKTRALEVVGLLSDRKPEVCKALAAVATSEDSWAPAVDTMATLGDACAAELDPIIDVIATAMKDNKYNTWEYQATKKLLRKTPLTKEQVKKLAPASKKLAKQVKGVFADSAKEIAASLAKYPPPAAKKSE